MAWTEVIERRAKHAKTFTDGSKFKSTIHSGTILHFETSPDDGQFVNEVNMTPTRINHSSFDGWWCENAAFDYALGKDIANHGQQDGWVWFGGRRAEHWLKFRLVRVGYLHYPTRSWQDVGGQPLYDRSNLSQETHTLIHEDGSVQVAQNQVTWNDIWSGIDIRWTIEGKGIKEDIILSEQTRNWIRTNRPPTTTPAETWFGFVFQLDVTNLPRWVKRGIIQNINGDFDDSDGAIEFRNLQDKLLGILPIDYAYSENDTEADAQVRLRKRIWKDPDGNHYLLVGARVPDLNAMPAGAIVFDPSTDITGDTADAVIYSANEANYADARSTSSASADTYSNIYIGQRDIGTFTVYRSVIKFDTSSLDGYTVTQVNLKMTIEGFSLGEDFDVVILKYDWSSYDPITSSNRETVWDALLTADTDDNIFQNTSGAVDETQYTSGNLNTAWIDTSGNTYYGLISQEDLDNSEPTTTEYIRYHSANSGTAAKRPILTVEYTTSTTHDLTVADVSHTNTFDTVGLVSVFPLSVADVSHTNTFDAPTLVSVLPLVVQDVSNAHAVDNLDLVSSFNLSVTDVSHTNSVDNLTLTGTSNITVQDIAHAHAVDNLNLQSVFPLTVEDVIHTNTFDSLNLVSVYQLSVNDVTHAHAVDNATLVSVFQLIVDDVTNAHTVDNVTATLVRTLTVQDATHGHTIDNLVLVTTTEGVQGILTIEDDLLYLLTIKDQLLYNLDTKEGTVRRVTGTVSEALLYKLTVGEALAYKLELTEDDNA